MPASASPSPDLVYALRRATEAAACAASGWIGRGDRHQGDQAAISAMRAALSDMDLDGTVVIGAGGRQEAPGLSAGERLGRADAAFKADLALDPVEGTSYLAKGQTNALAVMAVAPRGAMMEPGPAFYMEKFVAPPVARGEIDPSWPTGHKLKSLAKLLRKDVDQLTVYVLEKPRHRQLVDEIHRAGCRVALYPAGDVAGALLAAIPNSGIDALMGTGGVPEGVRSPRAFPALGGQYAPRLDPQLQTEAKAVREAGLDTSKWLTLDEIVASDESYFVATGITTGLMLDGVERQNGHFKVQSMMVAGQTGTRQVITSYLTAERVAAITAPQDAA
jgi:fructose-1,6-bisphosphatase II